MPGAFRDARPLRPGAVVRYACTVRRQVSRTLPSSMRSGCRDPAGGRTGARWRRHRRSRLSLPGRERPVGLLGPAAAPAPEVAEPGPRRSGHGLAQDDGRATIDGCGRGAGRVNDCDCPVEFAVKAQTGAGDQAGRGVVAAEVRAGAARGRGDGRSVEHPLRVRLRGGCARRAAPAAATVSRAVCDGAAVSVTQAPPDAVTHVDAASRNAIDFAMPVGTAIHAAREGVVINVAARHYRGGLAPGNMPEANFVAGAA